MDDNGNSRSSSDSVEIVQAGMDNSNSPTFINGHVDMDQYSDDDNELIQLQIVEQPQQRGFRFRYECEGPSHGGLQGFNTEKFRKTVPTIKINKYHSAARIVVSLVTDESVPKAHAHKLVGKNCKDGLCIVDVKPGTAQIAFPNLCVQHVTRKKASEVLEQRICESMILEKQIQQNDINANIKPSEEDRQKARQQASKQAKNIQLNVVRLCFQAFLLDNQGSVTKLLPSVISEPIYDSKAPGANALKICRMDKYSGCCTGNEEVFLLCEKVQKDDIQVRFAEIDMDGNTCWEAYANFGPFDVHRQFAIVFKTPEYRDTNIEKPVNVLVMLQRKSDGESSDPKSFTYYPKSLDQEDIDRKRKKKLPYPGKGGFSNMDPSGPFRGLGDNSNGSGGMSNDNGMSNGGSIPHLEQLKYQMNRTMYIPGHTDVRPILQGRRRQQTGTTIPQQINNPVVNQSAANRQQPGQQQINNPVMNQPAVNILTQPQQFLFDEVTSMSPLNQISGGNSPQYMNVESPQNYTVGSQHGGNSIGVPSPYNNGNNGSVQTGSPHSVNSSIITESSFNNGALSPQNLTQTSPHTSIGSPHAMIDPSSQNMTFGSQSMLGGSSNPIVSTEDICMTQSTQMQASIQLNGNNISQQVLSQPVQVSSLNSDSLETDFFPNNQQLYQQFNQTNQYADNKMYVLSARDIDYELNHNAQEIEHQLNSFSQFYGGQCSFQARCATGGMYSSNVQDATFGLDCIDGMALSEPRLSGLDEVDSAIVDRYDMAKIGASLKETASKKPDVFKTHSPIKLSPIDEKTVVATESVAKETPYARKPVVVKETAVTIETGVQAETVQQTDSEVQTDMDPTLRVAMKTSQALQYYASSGDIRALLMVQRFLMLVQDQNGDLPLHTSLINEKYEVFQNLLDVMATLPDAYSRINAYNFHHQTPLHLAVVTNQPLAVDLLVRAGGDTTLVDRNGYTPAHLAVLYGHNECLKNLLIYLRPGVTKEMPFPELNVRGYDGFTPAHMAAQLENLDAMKLLVYAKADINLADGKSGCTPLHHAVEADELSLAAYLILQAGADVNIKRFDGNTPLHIACGRGNVGMVALLMAGGADPNMQNDDVDEFTEDSDEEGSRDGKAKKQSEVDKRNRTKSEDKQDDKAERQPSEGKKDDEGERKQSFKGSEKDISDEERSLSPASDVEVDGELEVDSPTSHRSHRSLRGLTPADFADNNDKILRILNGEPYSSLSDTESDDEPGGPTTNKLMSYKLTSRLESGMGSMSIHSMKGDLDKIDYPTRVSLSKMLDPCKTGCDWSTLADKLGLKRFMEGHYAEHSPTRLLLTYFEETGGTVSKLSRALKELKREDAVALLNNLHVDTSSDGSVTPDIDKSVQKDPIFDSGMEDSCYSKSPSPVRKSQIAT